jgi:hypothetical protein
MMLENPNLKALTEVKTLAYILKFISDGKNEERMGIICSSTCMTISMVLIMIAAIGMTHPVVYASDVSRWQSI